MLWPDLVCDRLFRGDCMTPMLAHLAKAEAEGSQRVLAGRPGAAAPPAVLDPISATVIAMATRPLHLCLNEVGAAPFLDRPGLILPYNLMTRDQKQCVRDCIAQSEEWTVCNGVIVFRRTKAPVHLPTLAVLTSRCAGVLDAPSLHATPTRIALCNILLQRVQSHVPIDPDTQRRLNAWLAERMSKAPARSE